MKIIPADIWFSKCVRERVNWRCERCEKYYPEDNRRGLDCSHLFTRANYSIRFDPDNAFCHCRGCHGFFSRNPVLFTDWAIARLGEGLVQLLREKRLDTNLAKCIKKDLKGVAAHYRKEHGRMRDLRSQGRTGVIQIVSY